MSKRRSKLSILISLVCLLIFLLCAYTSGINITLAKENDIVYEAKVYCNATIDQYK